MLQRYGRNIFQRCMFALSQPTWDLQSTFLIEEKRILFIRKERNL